MSRKRTEYPMGQSLTLKARSHGIGSAVGKPLSTSSKLQRAARTISEDPERWPIGMNNTRRFPLWRFPLTVIFSAGESVILILAIAHGSRRPEYWINRFASIGEE